MFQNSRVNNRKLSRALLQLFLGSLVENAVNCPG